MQSSRIKLCIFLFYQMLPSGWQCQPPMPASLSYQQNGMPYEVPVSSKFQQGVDQSIPMAPPPPPPPISESNQQLEMIDAPNTEKHKYYDDKIATTPFPGYIAPPPSANYPVLIESDEIPPNPINQQSSNTYQSKVPLEIEEETKNDLKSCPREIQSFTDFLLCVQRLASVTLDENNLNCDFEKNSGCRFKPISSPLSVGNFQTVEHYRTFSTLSDRPESQKPKGNFAFFIEHRGTDPEDEFIISTPIICQKGNAILKFDYWIVGNPNDVIIRVCTQNHLARSCTQVIAYTPSSSSIAIEVVHPNSTFFELEIVASNIIVPTVIVYDNIEYKADLCEWEENKDDDDVTNNSKTVVDSFFEAEEDQGKEINDGSTLNEPLQDIEVPKDENVAIRPIRFAPITQEDVTVAEIIDSMKIEDHSSLCATLNCDLNNDMCLYKNYENESMVLSNWEIGNRKVGNPHTGVKDGSGFIYVGTDNQGSSKMINYILESQSFSTNEDFKLSFDIYRRSNDITLQICLDTPFYCPYSVSEFDKDVYWKQGETFLIPKGTSKIYLRAIQWRKFKWLAIDNIKVITDKC